MIHLTYFSYWLLRHRGCPARMLVTWAQRDKFCPCHPRAVTGTKRTERSHVPAALPDLPRGARPVGIFFARSCSLPVSRSTDRFKPHLAFQRVAEQTPRFVSG